MSEELKITKEDLVGWLDRPPSNNDLELCSYLANAVENQYKYYQETQQLKNKIEKAIENNEQIIKDTKDFYRSTSDKIYSGDCLIELAENNISILKG